MNRLEGELHRTINIYRSQQGGSAPTTLLLSGATSVMPYADQYFRDKYPNVTVDFFNPFRNIEIADGVAREELAKCAPFFGEVVGLGLRKVAKCHMEVNLLPPHVRTQRIIVARRPWLYATAASLILIPPIWWDYTRQLANTLEKENEVAKKFNSKLDNLKTAIDTPVNKAEKIRGNIDQIKSVIDANDYWSKLLIDINARVADVAPYAWINRFGPTAESRFFGGVSGGIQPSSATVAEGVYYLEGKGITGTKETKKQSPDLVVRDLLKRLRESPYLDAAGTDVLQIPSPHQDEYLYTFTLKVTLKKPEVL